MVGDDDRDYVNARTGERHGSVRITAEEAAAAAAAFRAKHMPFSEDACAA
jgi:hypothetical protein